MEDTQLSWQAWGENARLWVAERNPPAEQQVFIKTFYVPSFMPCVEGDLKDFKKTQRC